MTTVNNVYDTLYNNIKNKLTVDSKDGGDYTLGEYMLMKANAKKESTSLPVAVNHRDTSAVSAIISYVSDKLTVKTPPVKDKTIKTFPLRTSIAAFISSVLMCTLVFTYGIVALTSISTGDNTVSVTEEADEIAETETEEK